jgi:transcriptional regulator with XRE-family HTH domain
MTPECKRFRERMRARRIAASWSANALARRAHITKGYVGRVERGEQIPSLEIAARIAKALGVKLSDLTDP